MSQACEVYSSGFPAKRGGARAAVGGNCAQFLKAVKIRQYTICNRNAAPAGGEDGRPRRGGASAANYTEPSDEAALRNDNIQSIDHMRQLKGLGSSTAVSTLVYDELVNSACVGGDFRNTAAQLYARFQRDAAIADMKPWVVLTREAAALYYHGGRLSSADLEDFQIDTADPLISAVWKYIEYEPPAPAAGKKKRAAGDVRGFFPAAPKKARAKAAAAPAPAKYEALTGLPLPPMPSQYEALSKMSLAELAKISKQAEPSEKRELAREYLKAPADVRYQQTTLQSGAKKQPECGGVSSGSYLRATSRTTPRACARCAWLRAAAPRPCMAEGDRTAGTSPGSFPTTAA